MHTISLSHPGFSVKLLLTRPDGREISFNNCIELESNIRFPIKFLNFKVVDNKMFGKDRLANYNNILKRIIFDIKKGFIINRLKTFLKRELPTIFDTPTIQNRNREFMIYTYKDILKEAAESIGVRRDSLCELDDILSRVKTYEIESSTDGSILEDISDIYSEEMIDL